MILKNIKEILEKKFPLELGVENDRNGIQIENTDVNAVINKIIICLDLTSKVIDKAIEENANLIISHHPFLNLETNPNFENMKKRLNENTIFVLSYHTNADFADEGIAYNQAKLIMGDQFTPNSITKEFEESFMMVYKSDKDLFPLLKEKFNVKTFNYYCPTKFNKIYFSSGSNGKIIENLSSGDTLITGEAKWNHWVYAKEHNINLIEMGHFTEDLFVNIVSDIIKNENPNIKIITYKDGSIYEAF